MTDPFPGRRSTCLRQVIRVHEGDHDVLHVTGRPGRTTAAHASPSVRREVAKFVAASLVAVIVFVVASLPFLRRLGRTEAIRDARATARLAAAGVVEPNLDDALLERAPQSLARLDRVVQERVLSESIVRVKIWSPDGRIVYSDEPRLIGARFPLADDERETLVTGDAHAELSDLSNPENRFERPEGELLEVYSRVRTPNGTPVLFEIYQRYDSVIAGGRRIWLSFLPALLAALLLLWLVQVPLAYPSHAASARGTRSARFCRGARSMRPTTSVAASRPICTTALFRISPGSRTRSPQLPRRRPPRVKTRSSGRRCETVRPSRARACSASVLCCCRFTRRTFAPPA
jgi:hypothetical protein